MIDLIDLATFCAENDHKLVKTKVYGYITEIIDKPQSLKADVAISDNCVCVHMNLLAVNLKNYERLLKERGIWNTDGIYFVNGSISVFVDKATRLNSWYCCSGTLYLAKFSKNLVMGMYNFWNKGSAWGVKHTYVTQIAQTDFCEDSRVYPKLLESQRLGHISSVAEIEDLPAFYSDEPDIIAVRMNRTLGTLKYGTSDAESTENVAEQPTEQYAMSKKDSYCVEDNAGLRLQDGYFILKDMENHAKVQRDKFVDLIKSNYPYHAANVHLRRSFKAIKSNYIRANSYGAKSGKDLMKGFLTSCGANLTTAYLGVPIWSFISSIMKEILTVLLDGGEIEATAEGLSFIRMYFPDAEVVYAGILGEITGISARTLMNIAHVLKLAGVSFSAIANENPYLLGLIVDSLTADDLEHLAVCMGKQESKDKSLDKRTVQNYRCMAMLLHHLRTEYGDTVYMPYNAVENLTLGTYVYPRRYEKLKQEQGYLSVGLLANLNDYILEAPVHHGYQTKAFVRMDNRYCRALSKKEKADALERCVDCGLLVSIDMEDEEYIVHWGNMRKEFTCYDKIQQMMKQPPKYTKDGVDKAITAFEKERGVTLTESQRNAVHLLQHSVAAVEGMYGSGKQLVTECMTYVLQSMNKRAEVIHVSPVAVTGVQKLMNSRYVDTNIFNIEPVKIGTGDLYIIQNTELATVDGIYSIFKDIPATARVVFMGDMNAVCRPDSGAMFRNLLRILPCRVLTGEPEKGIRFVAQEVLSRRKLKTNAQTTFIPCADKDLPGVAAVLCKYHMGTTTPNETAYLESCVGKYLLKTDTVAPTDIQVLSVMDNGNYSWDCYNMNNVLRGVFNNTDSSMFLWCMASGRTPCKVGDKILHIGNGDTCQRYSSVSGGIFEKSDTVGIATGMVGEIEGFYHADDCMFLNNQANKSWTAGAVRNDTKWFGDDKWFIAVRYYDTDSQSFYFVLYRVMLDKSSTQSNMVFVGGDSADVQLGYCATPYRTVGMKKKLVLLLCGDVRSDDFMTKNLLYSAFKEATDGLYVLGSISNDANTAFGRARRVYTQPQAKVLGDLICS